MRFYLGTHKAHHLERAGVPLFLSRRTLAPRRTLPRAAAPWALDSSGFTELSLNGRWTVPAAQYVAEVRRFADEVGLLEWVAPQDWMTEDHVLAATGLTIPEHQRRTVASYLELEQELGELVIPVLQGQTVDDYLRCVDLYSAAGVDLLAAPTVGLGSVCRRQDSGAIEAVVTALAGLGLGLHGFGVKAGGLDRYADRLVSADSLAWSFRARRSPPMPGHTHSACQNCLPFALEWRRRLLASLDRPRQLTLC